MMPAAMILAGGRSRRMGGQDKAFLPLKDGLPMLDHVLSVLEGQVAAILINSNAPPSRFEKYRLPVLADSVPGHCGPLAGLLTGMLWTRQHHPGLTHLVSLPCDTPLLPHDIVPRLQAALHQAHAEIAIASDETGLHPTIGLWPVRLASPLKEALVHHGVRGMQDWLRSFKVAHAPCEARHLRNINTPQDIAAFA